jgi:hypothetical protein
MEMNMATLSLRGLFGTWYVKMENNTKHYRKAAQFVRRAYKQTGGPTPELERVYRTYTSNRER